RPGLSLRQAPPPGAAVHVASGQVAAAAVELRGGRASIAAYSIEPLPDGAVVPALIGQNIKDRGAVAAAVGRALDHVGRPRRVAVVMADPVAKISVLRFDHVPPRAQDLEQLIRWQVRKAAPFPPDEAQISYVEGLRSADGH